MKQFLITYRLKAGMEDRRRTEIEAFVAAIDADPELRGRMGYRCMKLAAAPDYYHIATAADDAAVKALQSRDFFARYTEQTEACADGEVDVSPLELIAETAG
ncbi:MAG TPA: hypothetical protein VHS78_11455 [Candidatus Elarobacter sp.]|nr:hypothetical protein [Candidatus Elarobacter sp.]